MRVDHSLSLANASDGGLSQDLEHSVSTFQNLQAERLGALKRENALLAELPTLKVLLTSGDDLTIQDGAVVFWQISGTDLFALADPRDRIVAAYTKTGTASSTLRDGLKNLLTSSGKHYLIDGKSLYACSLRPLYFGSDEDGTLLGYVISGVLIERTVRQFSQPTGVEATFFSNGKIEASTLAPALQASFPTQPSSFSGNPLAPAGVKLGEAHFLAAAEDLSATATSPLQLVVLESLEPAEQSISRINRMVLSAGLLALLCGTALMITLSRLVTRLLEELSKSVRAFGMGDVDDRIPRHGTEEVLDLSEAFARMQNEIRQANRALLESERLPSKGASSSWLLSFPRWEEEAVHDPSLPDIDIAGGCELPGVAGKNPGVVGKIVIKSEVGSLRVHRRKAIAGGKVVSGEGLLDAKYRLNTADGAIQASESLGAIVGFDPVALTVMAAREFGTQSERRIFWLPPDMRAIEILMNSLQNAIVGQTYFQTLIRQVEAHSTAVAVGAAKLLIAAADGIEV